MVNTISKPEQWNEKRINIQREAESASGNLQKYFKISPPDILRI